MLKNKNAFQRAGKKKKNPFGPKVLPFQEESIAPNIVNITPTTRRPARLKEGQVWKLRE
jgi:hypothetical protein